MRASSKELKDNNTATVILRLAELYDRLAERAESRSAQVKTSRATLRAGRPSSTDRICTKP